MATLLSFRIHGLVSCGKICITRACVTKTLCNWNKTSFKLAPNACRQIPIQTLSSVNLSKRPPKKRITVQGSKQEETKVDVFHVHAYATADQFDLESAVQKITNAGIYLKKQLPSDIEDAAYLTGKQSDEKEPRDVLLFRQGTVVFWNVPINDQLGFLKAIKDFEDNPYDEKLIQHEKEVMCYSYCGSDEGLVRSRIKNDCFMLLPSEYLDLDKYSYSNGLMLSVKLAIWENRLADYIDSIQDVTENLKNTGTLGLSRKDVLQKTGELHTLRHHINLSSNLLDTPDFYWDRDNLEKLYRQSIHYFSITERTKIVNEKLTHCIDLIDLLRDHLNHKHEVRLEWMIIILIMVEVLFSVVHIIERKLKKRDKANELSRNNDI